MLSSRLRRLESIRSGAALIVNQEHALVGRLVSPGGDLRDAAQALGDRSVDPPHTRMTGGPSPSRPNAMEVPSCEVTACIFTPSV